MTDSLDRHEQRRTAYLAALQACTDRVSRRRFLALSGASLALAGEAACAVPRDQIVPYVRPPQSLVPSEPLYFASADVLGGYAHGTLIETHTGRPTKVEGNLQHPASLGATDAFGQASVLNLYDPARSQAITENGQPSTWQVFSEELRRLLATLPSGGDGLRFLSGTITSPTFGAQMRQTLQRYPQARWHRWEPVGRDNARAGAQLAFGQVVEARYHFDAADVVVMLDADTLAWSPGRVRYQHDLALRRRPEHGALSRLYAVESTPSLFGAIADHRLPLPAHAIEAFAFALAGALGVNVGVAPPPPPAGVPSGWLEALASDLRARGRTALVVAGDAQPPSVHALAHSLNAALGSAGTTVEYTAPVEVDPVDHPTSLAQLTSDMTAGRVALLVMLGTNPVYTAPSDIPFASSLTNVATRVHLGPYDDETAALSTWHIPELHPMETWSDARSYDGTASILQPVIEPLYDGRSAHELLALFGDQPQSPSHDLVKSFWQAQHNAPDFDVYWRRMLSAGAIDGTAFASEQVSVQSGWGSAVQPAAQPAAGSLELVFRPDPSVFDGRFASNGWLQELPRPLSKLTWDNVALVSPATAQRLGLANQDVVELRAQGRALQAPVWLLPGQADDSIAVTLGYGRSLGAGAGTGAGFDAYALRTSTAPWFDTSLEVARSGGTYALASTQGHYDMQGRDLVLTVTPEQLQTPPQNQQPTISLYPPFPYPENVWGMVIDLNACVGCNACIVACQSENNIPVVGKEEVARGREMQWLRVDTYFASDAPNPRMLQQLVPCMQCEIAPCELVCPVGATVHSNEGLNDQVYQRCVGTRYCSNNCPYKVRHFNFFEYADFTTPSLKLGRNPEVTVRSRGVMEKCTYCVQRITAARIQAETENRPIQDGEVLTACQAACPSGAIVFGNLADPASQVAQQRALPRNYTLLAELNTRPRTTYLATVPNPNPAIGAS